MSRAAVVEREDQESVLVVPRQGRTFVGAGLRIMFWLDAVGFVWCVGVFLNEKYRGYSGFVTFFAAVWISMAVCLAGLNCGSHHR